VLTRGFGGPAVERDQQPPRRVGRPNPRAARRILWAVGKTRHAVDHSRGYSGPFEIFGQLEFNGDGVLSPTVVGDDASLRQVFDEIIAAVGSAKDRSSWMA